MQWPTQSKLIYQKSLFLCKIFLGLKKLLRLNKSCGNFNQFIKFDNPRNDSCPYVLCTGFALLQQALLQQDGRGNNI